MTVATGLAGLRAQRIGGARMTALVLLAAAAIAGCGSASETRPVQRTASPKAQLAQRPAHVAVIVMENEEYGDIIGSHSTPYITRLARRYALATGMYAISHPSLPN